MHLFRCNIHIFFAVLQILNSALCDDHEHPEATILPQNQIKSNNSLDTANSGSFREEIVEKRESNVSALPISGVSLVTPTSLKIEPIPTVNTTHDKVDSIEPSVSSSDEKTTSVKKQLFTPESNGMSCILLYYV